MKRPKILVLYTGGTFGMSDDLKIPHRSAQALTERMVKQVPEMNSIAECTIEVIFNTDSCQMNSTHWFTLSSRIREVESRYDGVVILHGTDTLAYSAAALSFLLGSSPIPVVFTGAQKPLFALRNDARPNLITAIEVAAFAPRELKNRVMVAFHDEVFLGSRVRKRSALNFAAFESPRFPVLAKVGSTIQYQDSIDHLPKISGKGMIAQLKNVAERSPKILKLEVTPEFPGEVFDSSVLSHVDAILLTLYTSGTAPTESLSFIQFLKRAQKSNAPVLCITEREDAPIDLSSYEAGRDLLREKVLWCGDLTPEAAFVKAWMMIARDRKITPLAWAKTLADESSNLKPSR